MKYSEYDCMSSCRKREYAVSSVIGVVLLLAMVVAVGAVAALIVSSDVSGKASFAPQVIFEPSADEYLLYHAGGDRLYRGDLIISWEGKDITANTSLVIPAELTEEILTKLVSGSLKFDSSVPALDVAWENWSTGLALMAFKPDGVDTSINVSEIQISANANGRLYAIYIGSSYVDGGYVPVIPTVVPGPAPTDKRFDITIEPCVYAAIKPYLTPEEMWLPWSGSPGNWRDGKNGHGVNVTVGPRNGSMIQNLTVEYVNDVGTNTYNVKNTFISGGSSTPAITFSLQTAQLAFRPQSKLTGNVLYFRPIADTKRNIREAYIPDNDNSQSYEFYVGGRGASKEANIPDTTLLSRHVDLNITNGNICVKIGYIDNGVSGYEYYWLNNTFIPQRAVNLNNADLKFENESYVTDDGVRGIELTLTGGANASEAAFYTVQGVSGALNGVVLDYDGSSGGVTIKKPDKNNAEDLTGKTYRYSIPEESSPSKDAIPDAEFLVTTYMWNGSAWWSNETIVTCTIPEYDEPQNAWLDVSVEGYNRANVSGVLTDMGHGINLTILKGTASRYGEIKITITNNSKSYSTNGGNPYYLNFDNNKELTPISVHADGTRITDLNSVRVGDRFYIFILKTNRSDNDPAMPDAHVKVEIFNESIGGGGGYTEFYNGSLPIPSRYPNPYVNYTVLSSPIDGKRGFVINISEINSIQTNDINAKQLLHANITLQDAQLLNETKHTISISPNTSRTSADWTNLQPLNEYYYDIDDGYAGGITGGTLNITVNRTVKWVNDGVSETLVNSTLKTVTIPPL